MQIDFIFSIIILIFSVVIHEVSHGYAAYLQGDNTARFQGRLTLNPFKHLEWFGSFLLPMMSYFLGGFIIGWAKPVPFNPYNLRNQRWGEAIVAVAGPLSNICIALFFGLLIRFGVLSQFGQAFVYIASSIVFINLMLGVFNLLPVPPLDGWRIWGAWLPLRLRIAIEMNAIFSLIFLIILLPYLPIITLVRMLFFALTGVRLW